MAPRPYGPTPTAGIRSRSPASRRPASTDRVPIRSGWLGALYHEREMSIRRNIPLLAAVLACAAAAASDCLVIQGKNGPGKGKRIVLVSGDEEYRSEQALPQLARILSERHGFDCTVLFAIDPKDGTIDPNQIGRASCRERV